MTRHVHPITIFYNLGRVLYLTIIPVLRGFFVAIQGDLANWVQGAWIDILVFLLMIILAVWRWWVVVYSYNNHSLTLKTGWIVRSEISIPWVNITTVSVIESFYLRPFRAAKLRADTIGGSEGKADFTLLVSGKEATEMLDRLRSADERITGKPRQYEPKTSSILSLALLTSNSLAGILFISAFVSQSGKLLGREFSDMIIGTFEEVARVLAFGVPPAAAAIAYILLAGWLIGFLLTFCRYKNFSIQRGKYALNIGGGVFTNRQYCISVSDITFLDIRQSVITKAIRLYSLYISAVGYGKQKDDISCIIPTEDHETFTQVREYLFGAFSPEKRQIAPAKRGFMRFIGIPLALCAALPLAMFILIFIHPSWRGFILFTGCMSTVPAVFFLVVRIIDFSTSGIAKVDGYLTLRYSKGFTLHTVIVPIDKVVCTEFRQSILQKPRNNCDLIISTRAETKSVHRCRNLNRDELIKIMV